MRSNLKGSTGSSLAARKRARRNRNKVSAVPPAVRRMEKKLASTVGEAARLARMRAGLTQSDVAARIGVAPEVYGRMERGKMLPSVPTLLRMCLALRTNPDEIMGIAPRHAEPAYAEDVPSGLNDTPDMRRLLRSLRRLQRPQIKLMNLVAAAIIHHY